MNLQQMDTIMQQLTAHQRKIAQVVYDGGGQWLARAQVARALGKKRLTPYDINCLKLLTEKHIIQMDTRPTTAPGSDFAYIYHMSDDVANVLQQWADAQSASDALPQRKPINLTKK